MADSILNTAAIIYTEFSRNTPLLVQLFFLYFGLPKVGIRISGEWCAIIGLAFLGGSYMAEALRAGLESVSTVQTESARVLGLTPFQTMVLVVLPQAFAVSVPPLVANIIFLIKEISVVSAIALPDLMYVTKDLIGNSYKTDESLILLVSAYVVLLLPISLLGYWLERRCVMQDSGINVFFQGINSLLLLKGCGQHCISVSYLQVFPFRSGFFSASL